VTTTALTRILVADDDRDIARMTSRFLGAHGYRCVTAGSGAQALAAFHEGGVDLLVTDLNMPVGNGVQLIQTIRLRSAVPVIIVTAYSREYADQVRFLPNVTLLNKPFEPEALLDLVGLMLAPGAA
jgi:DNA-binding response OmpR family regulator